jgi:outer membrane protein
MKFQFTVLLFSLLSICHAQTTQKIGHADWEYIFSQMPDYQRIESELKIYESQLQNQLKIKAQELETKYKSYQEMASDAPEPIRRDKESELASLQENLDKFQRDAQASMQKKQNDLINPVFAKVGEAIQMVAAEQGYSYILNPRMVGGGDLLLFTDEKYNISGLVLKKLGIEPKPDNKSSAKK